MVAGETKPCFDGRKKMDERKLSLLVRLLLVERLSVRRAADEIGVSHMTAYRALEGVRIN